MSRTRASVPRKSTSRSGPKKKVERKSAVKRTGESRRSAAVSPRHNRAKPTPKPARHGIRKPVKIKAKPRTAKVVKKTTPRERKPALRKAQPVNVKKSDDTSKMRRTTTDKTKAVIEKPVKKEQPVRAIETAKPKAAAVTAVPESKVKTPKSAVKATAPKVELPPTDRQPEPLPTTGRRKSRAVREQHDNGDGGRERTKAARARGTKIPGFDDELMQDYVMDEEVEEEELPDEMALDPLELPLELLDPELVEVPRPAAPPKLKQKVSTVNRRQQACANCGNTYTWLSVEQLCFSCLKKKLAQRKREDETYTGYSADAEEEEDAS